MMRMNQMMKNSKMKNNLTPAQYLASADPILGAVIEKITLPKRAPAKNHFYALVRAIMRQQLSGRAADAIERKFLALFSLRLPAPAQILAMPDMTIRSAGLSFAKISYIKNVARASVEGDIAFDHLRTLSDEEIIAKLTKIKGIGEWTAEMFLMFTLGREDLFSYGDLGLKNAMQRLYKMRRHPSKQRALQIAKKWSPHRSLACRYLWASLELNGYIQYTGG